MLIQPSKKEYFLRHEKFIKNLIDNEIDIAIIHSREWDPQFVRYLCGYLPIRHDAIILFSQDKNVVPILFVNVLNDLRAKNEAKKSGIGVETDLDIGKKIKNWITNNKIKTKKCCLIGDATIPFSLTEKIIKSISPKDVMISDFPLANVMMIKSEWELKQLKKSAEIAITGMKSAIECINEGVKEYEIVKSAEESMRGLGCEGFAFDMMVQSDVKSIYPDSRASHKKIKSGDAILIDLGAIWNGYYSDMSRTVLFNVTDNEVKKLYEKLVYIFNQIKDEKLETNYKCSDLNNKCVDLFKNEGLDKYFIHALGHGVGMGVHEYPKISSKSEILIEENMVFTIEPALYMPKIFGGRIEDVVYVKNNHLKSLTDFESRIYL